MAVQSPTLTMDLSVAESGSWRSRTLIVVLMAVIATLFWVDSSCPSLMKRYHAGSQVKATGALTLGTVGAVDRTMPDLVRVWRTTVNWLDANRVGMTFSFLFGPAALTFLATLRRRRTNSRYLNTLLGTMAEVPLGVCSNCIAPIARGLYASGMCIEWVLAAMFTWPALERGRARHVVRTISPPYSVVATVHGRVSDSGVRSQYPLGSPRRKRWCNA